MKQASNNIIAILSAVLIITISLEMSVLNIKYQKSITHEAIGLVGMCVDNHPIIIPISDQTAYIGKLYTYDVNTTIPNDANVTFYDNTSLFDINNKTGLIAFIPQAADEGVHYLKIWVVSICGLLTDSKTVKLTIRYENRPPVLEFIPDQHIYQNDLFVYYVNATDPDNDTLFFGDNTTMFQIINVNATTGLIYFTPIQQDVGNHSVLIWVMDMQDGKPLGGVDWHVVNFEIIDVNDAPVLQNIGSQTAIINETFTLKVNATDVDVKPEWNNLTFYDNATFFGIDPKTGLINFTANDSMNGTYFINISVTDGEFWDEEVISFSVVAVNHPPNITSWYPLNDTIYMDEGQTQYFNITKYDPDGTIPSSQWYLDTNLLAGETADEYNYYASYFSAGTHNVTIIISDGELTASHEWKVKVKNVPPPQGGWTPPSGGEARPPPCAENWRCSEWSVCPVYEIQTRTCNDINNCGTVTSKPEEQRKCAYTPQPNCSDSIANCHDGGCEIWIDCGGPCPPCATCSDKIKNCHTLPDGGKTCEEGTDCGGPCPPCKAPQLPVCGNMICEEGELFPCVQDCGFFFGQFMLAVIILGGASIFVYRTSAFLLMVYRKKVRPLPYTNLELLGAYTLRRIHLIQLEIGKKPVKTIVSEFSSVMREFFAKAFEIRKKYTYIELAEVARKRKIERSLANRILEFCIKMTEIEYEPVEPPITDLSAAIKNSISIVEKLTGIKIQESLDKRAEGEMKKIQPKEEQAKLAEIRPEKKEKKYVKTKADTEDVKNLEKLVADGEKAIAERRMEEAEKIYSQIRELYDKINPEVKKELYNETIRIIKMYNTIMREM
jgi:hypothetical protein